MDRLRPDHTPEDAPPSASGVWTRVDAMNTQRTHRRSAAHWTLSALVLGVFAVNAAVRFRTGYAHELLWACNLAPLLMASGLLAGWTRVHQLGFNWVCYGTLVWTVQLLSGDGGSWFSYLNHWGCLVLGLGGIRLLGLPTGGYWRTIAAFFLLQRLTPLFIGDADNVNMAFGVWPGSVVDALPYWIADGIILGGGLGFLWIVEIVLRRRWMTPRLEG